MKLFELFARPDDLENATYQPSEDTLGQRQLGDTRKPKLTLRAISKLKRIRAMKKLEDAKREDLLGIMYGGEGAEDAAGGGMGGGMGGF